MRREAEAIVPLRRNHPSLAIWCGGNELEDAGGPLDERHPVLAALRDVVARLDPDRGWLPTSPSGPRFHNRLEVIETDPCGLHDVHGPWEHQGLRGQYELYERGTSLLNSEFGVEGMASRRQVEAIVPADVRWPATRANPVYRHLGDWWINEPLVQSAFGGRLIDLERLARASRFLQAEGLRYAVEANRRRAPRNSGSIPWQFNASYPNAWCTAAVDHGGDPRPVYFAVARAYRPVHVCAAFDRAAWGGESRFRAMVWAWSFVEDLSDVRVSASVRGLDGRTVHESSALANLRTGRPAAQWEIETSPIPAPLFVLDLALARSDGRSLSANRYLFSAGDDFASVLDLEPATVQVACAQDGDRWRLEVCHGAGPAALGLVVEDARPWRSAGWAVPSDSGFDLLPGEKRTIDVTWRSSPVAGRALRIEGWNVDAVDVA
jgi:beta-mannosidase